MDAAKWIVAAIAVFNFGGYVADVLIPFTAKQHLHNPRWLPHAELSATYGMAKTTPLTRQDLITVSL